MKLRYPAVTAAAASGLLAWTLVASANPSTPHAATSSERAATSRHSCVLPGPYEYPHAGEPVRLRPRDFTVRIDNPYWPMRPGRVWRYVERDASETQHVRVRVTHRTRLIQGIRARVVHDVVRSGGEVVEDTFDWYAQDSGGSIWYLGEATKEFEDGRVVSTEGSWLYGRDGAQAGIIVPSRTHAGCRYREEYLPGEAADRAIILSRQETVRLRGHLYRGVLHTANWTPLEPGALENKLYARGVGPVLETDLAPRWSRNVLVRVAGP